MCKLYSLPLDSLRASLQYVQLRDISRLILATNNRQAYGILTEVLQGMVHYTEVHHAASDSLYDWAREKGIRLSTIILSSAISPYLISYLKLNGNWVTHVTYNENISKDVQFYPFILHYLPNVHNLRINTGLELHYTQMESEVLLQTFHVLPVKVLNIFMISSLQSLCEFNLSSLLQTFPLLEKLESGSTVSMTTFDSDTVYSTVKYIENMNSRYSRYFPNLENISYGSDWDLRLPAAGNKYKQLHYTITSDAGFQILHQLLNVMPQLSQLKLTCSDRTAVMTTLNDLKQRYTNLLSLNIRLTDISRMTYLIEYQFLLPCCPNLSTIEVRDCHSSWIVQVCSKALLCCKKLTSLTIYVSSGEAIKDSISNILNCCQEHQYIRTLGVSFRPLVYVEFYPYATTQYLCARKCTALFHVELANYKGDLDIHMLYEACPTIKSIRYWNGESYRLFQNSHSQLESISIHSFQDNGLFDDSRPTAQFPSLRSMSISGSIDCDSWKRMLSKCEFSVHRLTVRDKDSLSAITDTLLHHRNFRELQYVFVEKMNSHQLEELSAKTGRRIQFHNSCWLQLKRKEKDGPDKMDY